MGLDISQQMGRLAQARCKRALSPYLWQGEGWVGGEPPLVRARAQAMPFQSGSFDSVVSTFPAEFIIDPATLAEIARVMKSDGRAVVVPGVVFKRSLPARFLAWLYTVTGQQEPAPPGLAQALAEAGLAIETEREPMGMVDVLVAVAKKTNLGEGPASPRQGASS